MVAEALRRLADAFDAVARDAEVPGGSRAITLSDPMAKQIAHELRMIAANMASQP